MKGTRGRKGRRGKERKGKRKGEVKGREEIKGKEGRKEGKGGTERDGIGFRSTRRQCASCSTNIILLRNHLTGVHKPSQHTRALTHLNLRASLAAGSHASTRISRRGKPTRARQRKTLRQHRKYTIPTPQVPHNFGIIQRRLRFAWKRKKTGQNQKGQKKSASGKTRTPNQRRSRGPQRTFDFASILSYPRASLNAEPSYAR